MCAGVARHGLLLQWEVRSVVCCRVRRVHLQHVGGRVLQPLAFAGVLSNYVRMLQCAAHMKVQAYLMGGHSIAHITRHQRHADIFIQCVRSAPFPSHAGYGTRLHVLLVNALAGTNGRKVQLGPNGVPPLPYVAPFTVCVVELLDLIRNFILDRCVASCAAHAQQGRTQAQGPSHTLQRNTCILPAHNRRNLSDLVTMHEGPCKALGPRRSGRGRRR